MKYDVPVSYNPTPSPYDIFSGVPLSWIPSVDAWEAVARMIDMRTQSVRRGSLNVERQTSAGLRSSVLHYETFRLARASR